MSSVTLNHSMPAKVISHNLKEIKKWKPGHYIKIKNGECLSLTSKSEEMDFRTFEIIQETFENALNQQKVNERQAAYYASVYGKKTRFCKKDKKYPEALKKIEQMRAWFAEQKNRPAADALEKVWKKYSDVVVEESDVVVEEPELNSDMQRVAAAYLKLNLESMKKKQTPQNELINAFKNGIPLLKKMIPFRKKKRSEAELLMNKKMMRIFWAKKSDRSPSPHISDCKSNDSDSEWEYERHDADLIEKVSLQGSIVTSISMASGMDAVASGKKPLPLSPERMQEIRRDLEKTHKAVYSAMSKRREVFSDSDSDDEPWEL